MTWIQTGQATEIVTPTDPQTMSTATLTNTYWKLLALSEITVKTGLKNRELSMLLRSDMANFRGYGGCNKFSGQYELKLEKLNFDKILSTKKLCPDTMQQEKHFFAILHSTRSYKIFGESLTLFDITGRPIGRFESRYMQ